jgi:hypothetical protein
MTMSALVNLSLAPFAMIFRISYANPWLAIAISFAAGGVGYLTGHDLWGCTFISFGSYIMMWLGEQGRPPEQGTHEEQA